MADRDPNLSVPNRFMPGGEAFGTGLGRRGSLGSQTSRSPNQADNFRTRTLQQDADDRVGDHRRGNNTTA